MASRQIKINNISKSLQNEKILENLSLEIPSGKFFALLGPSGCGKTTLLRLIAGLDHVDSGSIFLGEENITYQPIYLRRINTVFQQYALFPHLSVFENVAYSLRIKKFSEATIREKVFAVLKSVRLVGRELKPIHSLSGGQQQRVALARAMVNEPDVLLFDEPLAALDLTLREQMLLEFIELQDKTKTTFVYVTHDQTEALTLADKMAIMNEDGQIEQIGTPKEIYEFPISKFVARFVGKTNILEGTLNIEQDSWTVSIPQLGAFSVYAPPKKDWMVNNAPISLSLRPEKIFISKHEQQGFANHLKGQVVNIIYHGRATQYLVMLSNGQVLTIFEQNEEHFPQVNIDYDDYVHLYFQKENVVLLER